MSKSATKSNQSAPEGFTISRARDGGFESGGLRQNFEYRDLDIAAATKGRLHAHVVRIGGLHGVIIARNRHSQSDSLEVRGQFLHCNSIVKKKFIFRLYHRCRTFTVEKSVGPRRFTVEKSVGQSGRNTLAA